MKKNPMDQVEVQFLGSGDALGSGGRFQTCVLVQSEKERFLIDCGASSLIAMKRFGVDPSSIQQVLISHLHGDHFGGIPFLVLDGQFSRRTLPLTIAGPTAVEARVGECMEVLFPGSSRIQRKFSVDFIEFQNERETTLGPLSVIPYAVVHPSGSPSYALRVRFKDRVIVYSGDTEWTEVLLEAAHQADLFICEAYYLGKKVKYHLDYRTILDHRAQLECRRILMTHMSQDMLSQLGRLEIDWAEDGKRMIL
jgi:ribonuclease BN (tRNA processing enzyme)